MRGAMEALGAGTPVFITGMAVHGSRKEQILTVTATMIYSVQALQ